MYWLENLFWTITVISSILFLALLGGGIYNIIIHGQNISEIFIAAGISAGVDFISTIIAANIHDYND